MVIRESKKCPVDPGTGLYPSKSGDTGTHSARLGQPVTLPLVPLRGLVTERGRCLTDSASPRVLYDSRERHYHLHHI